MATCRECLHFESCLNDKQQTRYYSEKEACNNVQDLCRYFLSKSDYVKRERGEWISVKDRLPDKYEIVIVCTDKNFIYAGELIGDTWFLDNDSWTEIVTHWMPLPEPPKDNPELLKGGVENG